MNATSFQVVFSKPSERNKPPASAAAAAGSEQPVSKAAAAATGGSGAAVAAPADALSLDFSYDSDILAVGTSRGVTLLHADANFRPASFDINGSLAKGEALTSAASCVRFQPHRNAASMRDMMLVACTDGSVSLWHLGSVQMVFGQKIKALSSDGNPTGAVSEQYACDFAAHGGQFVVGGDDSVVRLFDAQRGANVASLRLAENGLTPAHSGRIQALRWVPHEDLVLSAAADLSVQLWDVRTKSAAVHHISDTLVQGPEGLDVNNGVVVVASNRPARSLLFFDLRNALRPLLEVKLPIAPSTREWLQPESTSLFAARMSPDGRFIACGGGKDFRVVDFNKTLKSGKLDTALAAGNSGAASATVLAADVCGEIKEGGGVDHAIFSCAWHPSGQLLAAAGYGNQVFALRKMG